MKTNKHDQPTSSSGCNIISIFKKTIMSSITAIIPIMVSVNQELYGTFMRMITKRLERCVLYTDWIPKLTMYKLFTESYSVNQQILAAIKFGVSQK